MSVLIGDLVLSWLQPSFFRAWWLSFSHLQRLLLHVRKRCRRS